VGERERERETERETERQRDRETETERDRERERKNDSRCLNFEPGKPSLEDDSKLLYYYIHYLLTVHVTF
jgi:5'-3' exonuclease